MPPIAVGPPGDPQGLGPTASLGPPPGPMYPNPGPYTAPMYQPSPESALGYGLANRLWFNGEYLLLFGDSQSGGGFPLLTTGSPGQAGVLGAPTTTVLVGGGKINYGAISGFRLGGGFYGDADRRFGFDLGTFYAQPTSYSKTFATDSDINGAVPAAGIPVLARPFIDTVTGNTSLVVVSPTIPGATPGSSSRAIGSAKVSTRTSTWAADPSAIWNVFRSDPSSRFKVSVDLLAGYKYLQFNEEFIISSRSELRGVTFVEQFTTGPFGVPVSTGFLIVPTPVGVGGVVTAAPSVISIADRFVTTNKFNGGNFGARTEFRYGMFTVTATGKIAVGSMHETLRIRGVTSFNNSETGRAGYAFGGLYANASNIGTFTNDEFCVIPDVNLTVGINLTRSLSMYLGYNFLYISRAIRPGNQLSPIIDASTVPFSPAYGGTASIPAPVKGLISDDYYLQGVSFGFGFKY
ncbi:MAG: BBP7 family outer membrane beta-barrel protein [Gemmataceae bacterium]